MKIGSYTLPSNILLAPMAGVTDLPFRLICREHGAKFAFFEMIDCNSIIYGKKKENDIIRTTAQDKPIAAQLVGPDPEMMLKAAKVLIDTLDIKFLDINAACPVKKMMQKKAGAYLIKEPENLYKIIKLLSSELDIPITVKLRSGYHKVDHDHIRDIAKKCEKNGASALFIHGRTQKQGYSGGIDIEAIKTVKEAVKIPVIGSGNIFAPLDAKNMLDDTGCDGILIARGAYGNPWIFQQTELYVKDGVVAQQISMDEKLKVLKKHLSYISKYRTMQETSKLGYMRKISLYYIKDWYNACNIRRIMNNVKTYEQLAALIDRIPEITEKDAACL